MTGNGTSAHWSLQTSFKFAFSFFGWVVKITLYYLKKRV